MYQTCLFCNKDLGSNQILEALPIGRRLAFDSSRGRLWVVCRKCERWNLVPFDSRLEAIDACERLFRSTRTRYATGEIGIARVGDGMELVRIGAPEREEFAAWRYGDQFGRRRRRTLLLGTGAAVVVGGVVIGGLTAGVSLGMFPQLISVWVNFQTQNRVAARLNGISGISGALNRSDLQKVELLKEPGEDFRISLPLRQVDSKGRLLTTKKPESVVLAGDDALRALSTILPALNSGGGSRSKVSDAVTLVESSGDPLRLFQERLRDPSTKPALSKLGTSTLLAAEMLLHEENERVAMAGELRLLERQWRDAERLAQIADDLALPESTDQELAALRRKPVE